MTERRVTAKAELLADTEQGWSALNAALDRLAEVQLTTIRDAQGWSVKDHLVHLTAWERSMVYLLSGRPRHEGLGVEEAVYLKDKENEDDEINAVIQAQHKDLPLPTVLSRFREVHQQLLHALEPLTDADLQLPYRHYLPDEPGEGDGPPVLNMIYGNSADHFTEHLEWIESLVG